MGGANGSTAATEAARLNDWARADRHRLAAAEYARFRRDGFLVVRGLVEPAGVEELRKHTDDLMQGKLPEQNARMQDRDVTKDGGVTMQGLEAPPEHLTPTQKAQYFLRIHMLHRKLELHERYLLHPKVLDVVEALIGPDVLAMQTMLFLKPPGKPGQGWHQDSYYIPTFPDSLLGAWIAIDAADEWNGAMWFATGSQHEPIYPPADGYGYGQRDLANIGTVTGVSNPVDTENELAPVADRYSQLLVSAQPGDVVFFGGHVLHRSKLNATADRFRRAFVSHYCNARSFTQWGGDDAVVVDPATKMTNGSHILARGDSHLPFARPKFGTPCAALLSDAERRTWSDLALQVKADMGSGDMGVMPGDPTRKDDDSGYGA